MSNTFVSGYVGTASEPAAIYGVICEREVDIHYEFLTP